MQSLSQIYLALPEKTPSLLNWIHLMSTGLNVQSNVYCARMLGEHVGWVLCNYSISFVTLYEEAQPSV